MAKNYSNWLTDEEVEFNQSEAVALAQREAIVKYKPRRYLYQLRDLEKKGIEMMKAGITRDVPDAMYGEDDI
jgi:hypothetical protein